MADIGKQPYDTQQKTGKKPFDKKKWREQKYSTKAKVQKWQEKRKNILKKQLDKQLSKEGIQLPIRESPTEKKPNSRIKEAQMQYEERKQNQRKLATEAQRNKEEKLKKIKEMRAKKLERLKILNQKTRKGQPLMKGRLELLRSKIERMVAENRL